MGEGAPGRPGVTEEEDTRRVSRIRQRALELDGQPFLLAAARRLRRQLPGDASFGDPLSTAGDHPASVVGRQVSALSTDRPSAARELGLDRVRARGWTIAQTAAWTWDSHYHASHVETARWLLEGC